MSIVRPTALALAGLCGLAVPLCAHPVAQGAMEIELRPGAIRLKARVSMEELFVQSAMSGGAGTGDALVHQHGEYLLQHVRVFADDTPVTGRLIESNPPETPGAQRAGYTFEYSLDRQPARIRIAQDVLNEFTYAPGNRWEATYLVRFLHEKEPPREGLLLTSREALTIDITSPPGSTTWLLFREYLRHGVLHILTGYDHLLFIAALVLASVTLWDLIKVITAFTLAHTITLTLSVLDLVRLPGRVVEPMIAASIVFVALQNLFWPKRSRGAAQIAIAFFFGLFHGLGFAGGLLEAMQGMAALSVGLALLAFSVGVELGHQIVVVPLFGGLRLVRSQAGRDSPLADRLFRYGSAAISLAGMFYLFVAVR